MSNPRVPGYSIRRLIGAGAAASVFEAVQCRTGRSVALKVLPDRPDTPAWVRDAFRREAALHGRCQSDRVVTVYDAGAGRDCLFIALEYVPGDDLGNQLARSGPVSERKGLCIARDVARALCATASAGVLHGDVKPANLLGPVGQVKLADFGSARPLARPLDPSQPAWLGSPPFVAPELVLTRSPRAEHRGYPIDGRADLYSLGLTLFVALTGAAPTAARTPPDFIRWIVEAEVPDPRRVAGHLSLETAELIASLTRKDPADRPRSAAILGDRIDALLAAPTASGG